MSVHNSAKRASIGYTIGNVLIRGLSFLTLPLFTRLMSIEDYGLYTTYIAYESILSIVLSLALHASLKNAKIEFACSLDEYVSTIQSVPILLTIAIIICTIPFIDAIGAFLGFSGLIAILMIVQALATGMITMYNCRIGLDFAYKSYVGISMILSVSNIVLSLIFILTICSGEAFLGRVYGTCLPMIAVSVYILYVFYKKARPRIHKGYIRFGLLYSLPLIPHGLSQIILAQFGKIIIQNQIGNSAAGIYGFAYTVALIPQILMQSLDMAWGPWFYNAYSEGKINEIKSRTNQYVSIFAIITIILFVLSPEMVKIMADETYWDSINIVGPAVLGVFFTFLYGIPAQIEYYHKKTSYIAIGTVIAALLNISLCIYFIPIYGYEAAVYITIITYVIYFAAHLIIANVITNWKPPFDMKKILEYVVVVCILCLIGFMVIELFIARMAILLIGFIYFYKENKAFVDNTVLNRIRVWK